MKFQHVAQIKYLSNQSASSRSRGLFWLFKDNNKGRNALDIDKMAARNDQELQELNEIFKALAIRNNRFRPIFKNHDFSVSLRNFLDVCVYGINQLFGALLDLPNIKVQTYGSMAEELNYRQDFEDPGDFDLMIFPTSENMMVHEEMIEYLPENPMHVKIKGVDHPVLRSCLVEDTEYVATSALKNFHPAIYGILGDVFPCTDQWITQDRMFSHPALPFFSFHFVKNSAISPAITIAVAASKAKASFWFETVKESMESGNQFETNGKGQPVIDLSKHLFSNASNKEDENIPGERGNIKFWERCFVGDIKRMLKTLTAEECVFTIDVVPALPSVGWPKVAAEWIEIKRKWPSPSTVNKVIQEGFHLVVKPPKNGGSPDCDFRISFSHAEFLLSQEMNEIQRECYLCLKQYHQAYLFIEPDSLTTFHLKNIYLKTIEETGAEMWTEGNRAECMTKLLGNLLEALRKKDLRHFFVRSYNLFCTDYIKNPEILESLAETVDQIMKNPMKFSKDMLQNQHSEDPWPWQVKREESVASRKFTPFAKLGTESQEHVEIDGALATQREHGMMSSTVFKTAANQPINNSLTSHSADDLKEIFFATMKELADMASNDDDDALEALDPLEKSLVKEFRDIRKKWSLERFSETVHRSFGSNQLFMLMALRPEPNVRRRVLAAIRSVVELVKYFKRQVDSGAPGGAVGAVFKMFDTTAEDTLNWSHVMPPGLGLCVKQIGHSFFNLLTEHLENCLPKPAQLQELDMDDIPLD